VCPRPIHPLSTQAPGSLVAFGQWGPAYPWRPSPGATRRCGVVAACGACATIYDENQWRVAEMKITFWPRLLLAAVASAASLNAHAVTVTIDGRSLTADEICDARFVKDTPPYYRTTPTAVPGDERTRWAPLSDQARVQKGVLKEWCVPSFQYFVFCFKDNEHYPRDAVEFLNCRRDGR
jgi:hypothetical protein